MVEFFQKYRGNDRTDKKNEQNDKYYNTNNKAKDSSSMKEYIRYYKNEYKNYNSNNNDKDIFQIEKQKQQ